MGLAPGDTNLEWPSSMCHAPTMLARLQLGLACTAMALCVAACPKPGNTGSGARDESPSAPPSSEASAEGLPDRDAALAHRLVEEEGALLLDVRTPDEFAAGHIDGARNVPHDQVEARIDEIEAMVEGDKDTPIVVYCRSGRRAGIAKDALRKRGFGRITNLGGMSDW